MGLAEPQRGQERAHHVSGLQSPWTHMAPLSGRLGRRQNTDHVFWAAQPTASCRSHHWGWRGTARRRDIKGGWSFSVGVSSMGSFQRPSRACRTGASREEDEWMEMPGAPRLVSQQSNP